VPTLVTGATGFLGGHLVPLLLERGDHLRALVRQPERARALRDLGVELAAGDVTDEDSVRRAASDCELVFHLAGIVSHRRSDWQRLRSVNVDGVRAVLDAAEKGTRVVHVSSVAAFGPGVPDRPGDESQGFPERAMRYPYAATKRQGDDLALAAAERGVDVVIANPGFVLGPGDVYRVSTWHVQRYLQGLLRITTPGGLSNVDARDVATGLIALAQRGRRGERYILTSREGNLSHAEFFRRVGEVTGVRRRLVALSPGGAVAASSVVRWPVHPDEVRAAANWWFFDPAKAERELDFTARPMDETLAATAEQYVDRGR
jgi:dihydroflavonol-4-reductase